MDEKDFLQNFKMFLLQLPQNQKGTFVTEIDSKWGNHTPWFLHQLCRKIDIKKSLYVSYDEKRDLLPTEQTLLNDDYWLKIIYVLVWFVLNSKEIAIKYKAINTLLKVRDIVSEKCNKNDFVLYIYDEILKNAL